MPRDAKEAGPVDVVDEPRPAPLAPRDRLSLVGCTPAEPTAFHRMLCPQRRRAVLAASGFFCR